MPWSLPVRLGPAEPPALELRRIEPPVESASEWLLGVRGGILPRYSTYSTRLDSFTEKKQKRKKRKKMRMDANGCRKESSPFGGLGGSWIFTVISSTILVVPPYLFFCICH
jgi:hypothetical protein